MPPPQERDPLQSNLDRLWISVQPEIQSRLRVIEDYVVGWEGGRFNTDAWRAAQRDAHRLAGSLGVFGFAKASELARQLNRLLETDPPSAPGDQASDLLTAIRGELEHESLLDVDPQSDPDPDPDSGPEPQAPGMTKPARVLLAEDDDSIAAAVRVSLQLDGLELLWARDGAEAVRMASENDIDLVLLDLDLPIIDGLEVCRQLREDPRLSTIPIVLMTGQSFSRGGLSPASQCITAYLAKPFRVADLRSRVRTLLASGPAGFVC